MENCNLILFFIFILLLLCNHKTESYVVPSLDPYKHKVPRRRPKVLIKPNKENTFVLPSYNPGNRKVVRLTT